MLKEGGVGQKKLVYINEGRIFNNFDNKEEVTERIRNVINHVSVPMNSLLRFCEQMMRVDHSWNLETILGNYVYINSHQYGTSPKFMNIFY